MLYTVLLWRWDRRDYRPAVLGGLTGLGVHVVELTVSGWSAYPDLMAINLLLPGLLAPVAWRVGQKERKESGGRLR